MINSMMRVNFVKIKYVILCVIMLKISSKILKCLVFYS